ncbi:SH3 domain-containing protein [Fusobacterium polymorphum]|uniref:SH3 domain-containing protein n=1 Tax=Fusobacterium nucleatum subsp. polymorphum TaxID=76857 RepID=UPI00300A7D76
MKKNLLFLIFLILSLTSLGARFIVNSKDGYANLRREAAIDSEIIVELDNSIQVSSFFKRGDWYYVEVLGTRPQEYARGFIHESQLEFSSETYVVSSQDGYANIRYKPIVNSDIVDILNNGEYVTKLNEVGDWYYIEFTAYNYGYIHKSQLKKFTK